MKKVLFLFAFLLLGIGAMAQKVIYDETNQTGVRTVVCEGMNLGVSNNMDVYVALAGFQYKSTIRYSLAVTIGSGHEVEIPNDSKCVLTLDNGKAKELKKIGKNGIVQMDIQLSPGNYSIAFNQDVLGSMLTGSMSLINNMFGK